jgi:hypothetical protein
MSGSAKDLPFDFLPCSADNIGRRPGCNAVGKQNARDARGEAWISQYLLEIVNEVCQAKRCDPPEFFASRVFEVDTIGRDTMDFIKQPLSGHPVERGLAEVDAITIMVPEFGFVADDGDGTSRQFATAKERFEARHHGRIDNALAVNLPLQTLPGELATGQKPDGIANLLTRPSRLAAMRNTSS